MAPACSRSHIEIKKTGKDSFLLQVINLVREAQGSKSRTQNLANRTERYLTLIALTGGTVPLLVWFSVVERDFAFALERTVTAMFITCPHALGLTVPLAVTANVQGRG